MAAWTEYEILKSSHQNSPKVLHRIEECMDYIAEAVNYLQSRMEPSELSIQKPTMKITTIDSTLFVVSEASRSQADDQIPNQEWDIQGVYDNAYSPDITKRIAWAIYKKSAYPKPANEFDHVRLALQLQWKYDHAEELQVIE